MKVSVSAIHALLATIARFIEKQVEKRREERAVNIARINGIEARNVMLADEIADLTELTR